MFAFTSKLLRSIFDRTDNPNGIVCFHCGELSRPKDTVYVLFEGARQPVCCFGCAAVLKTVEELDMTVEYKASKAQYFKDSYTGKL